MHIAQRACELAITWRFVIFKFLLDIYRVGSLQASPLIGVLRLARCPGGGFATFQVCFALGLESFVLLTRFFHLALAFGLFLLENTLFFGFRFSLESAQPNKLFPHLRFFL